MDTIKQRHKILKIADRHGWDTVNEYPDDPLADSVEDATKLRAAIDRASIKRNTPKPYSRGSGKGGFEAKGIFVASAKAIHRDSTTFHNKTPTRSPTMMDFVSTARGPAI